MQTKKMILISGTVLALLAGLARLRTKTSPQPIRLSISATGRLQLDGIPRTKREINQKLTYKMQGLQDTVILQIPTNLTHKSCKELVNICTENGALNLKLDDAGRWYAVEFGSFKEQPSYMLQKYSDPSVVINISSNQTDYSRPLSAADPSKSVVEIICTTTSSHAELLRQVRRCYTRGHTNIFIMSR
jgi:hypothetical protein